MTVNSMHFYSHLKKEALKPLYLLASDVTLLQQEARNALRQHALAKGFVERITIHVENSFNWPQFFSALQNYDIFNQKTLHELHYPAVKFDKELIQLLTEYFKNPPADKILLFLTPKLTSAQLKTKWYQLFENNGMAVEIRSITKAELPQWIVSRAHEMQLNLNRESISLLAELTEGNLLASQQALEKLKLLYPQELIKPTEIWNVIQDSAQFNVFDLGNYLLLGQTQQALRCMRGLKESGTEPTLILWAITREIRELLILLHQQGQGIPLTQLLQRQWQSRRASLKQALTRTSISSLNRLLSLAEKTDKIIKGLHFGKPWEALETLILGFGNHTMHIL